MSMEDLPSMLVIECDDEASREDPNYWVSTENCLDKIASSFSIENPHDAWKRISVPSVIGILGAPRLTEAAYQSLEQIVAETNTRFGTVIVLIVHSDCECTDSEQAVLRLSRAALRLDLMLGEKANEDQETNWAIRCIQVLEKVPEGTEEIDSAVAHIYRLAELRMMSGGQVNLDVILDLDFDEHDNLEEAKSDELETVDSDDMIDTRPVPIPSLAQSHSDNQAELLSMNSFARQFEAALSTASVRQARVETQPREAIAGARIVKSVPKLQRR